MQKPDAKDLEFRNKGEDNISVTYLKFQSTEQPRFWDTSKEPSGNAWLLCTGTILTMEIYGEGEIFIKWETQAPSPVQQVVKLKQRADHFTVRFDRNGEPYPYIFGGDKWTMALRQAALRAEDGN